MPQDERNGDRDGSGMAKVGRVGRMRVEGGVVDVEVRLVVVVGGVAVFLIFFCVLVRVIIFWGCFTV